MNIIDMPRVGFQTAKQHILSVWQAGGTPYLIGRPGEAKSACIESAAIEYQATEFIPLEISRLDPVSIGGYDFPANPDVNDGYAIANKPHWFPKTDQPVILLDDYADGAPATRAAAYTLLHPTERRAGNWKLPELARVACASNRASDGALSGTIGTAEANRVVFYNFEQSAEEWIESFGMDYATAENCAFLQWQPELFNTFDPKKKGEAFASARSWDQASRLQRVMTLDQLRLSLPGTLGVSVAAQYCNFLRLADDLPDINDIREYPETAPAPTEPSAKHLVISVIARHACEEDFGQFLTYVKALGKEFTQAFIQQAIRANPSVCRSPDYLIWTKANDVRLKV